ncbi:ABC transporter permease, partial [Candidatus Sumerlaeota bacterium]|nr:ABC transporter permease [Candidatus Sumerlaeota bacterium]
TNGRDVLARMIYGTRVSMLVSIVAVAIYTMIGMLLGAVAGYFRGWTDIIISRLTEVVICFPALMVILSVQAFLKPSILNIILTMAALWWTGVQRLQRGEFLRLVNLDYVQAVRALGGSNLRIMAMHILPNALGPILVMTSFGIAGAILVESALSFLGFGVPQPMASWGDLLNNGRNDINGTWWLTVFPGLAIFLTVTCFNLVGEGFRDALDPQRER